MYGGNYDVRWRSTIHARVRLIAFIAPLLLNCAERLHFGALREIHSYLFEYCS